LRLQKNHASIRWIVPQFSHTRFREAGLSRPQQKSAAVRFQTGHFALANRP
jgi:hypothetical protein